MVSATQGMCACHMAMWMFTSTFVYLLTSIGYLHHISFGVWLLIILSVCQL